MLYGVTGLGETFQQERLRDIEQCVAPGGTESAGDVSTHVAVPNGRVGTPGQPSRVHPGPGDGTLSATPRCMLQ